MEVLSFPVFSAGDGVEAFAFDPNHNRLAITSHYGQIKMLRYQNRKFTDLWGDEMLETIPHAVLFSDSGHSLMTFVMETGGVYGFPCFPLCLFHLLSSRMCRDAQTSMTLSAKNMKTAMYVYFIWDIQVSQRNFKFSGYVSLCHSTGNIIVDNMHDGFDLYPPNRHVLTRTFPVEATKMYIKASVFGEGGKIVACGSDHRRVYIFGIGETKVKQELVHGNRHDMIQALEVRNALRLYLLPHSLADCNDSGLSLHRFRHIYREV